MPSGSCFLLQEEMEKNRKTGKGEFAFACLISYIYLVCFLSAKSEFVFVGVKPEASSRRVRDVACPTCTVHLQV